MSAVDGGGAILTLEPLVEAVRDGLESRRWELSGLQKTTSHRFEGKWEGEDTRSAYLFFHHAEKWEDVSIDVYLDETPEGLQGNLALVLDGREVDVTGDVRAVLRDLGSLASRTLPEGYRTPVSARYRIPDGGSSPDHASVEFRFKLRIPRTAIQAGSSAVSALASAVAGAFERLLAEPGLAGLAFVE